MTLSASVFADYQILNVTGETLLFKPREVLNFGLQQECIAPDMVG
jgi:hypothetical protein